MLRVFVQEEIKALLRLPSRPSPGKGFFELGMDSLVAVELRNRLRRAFDGNIAVSNTVALDYPNVEVRVEHLAEKLGTVTGGVRTDPPDGSAPHGSGGLLAGIPTGLGADDG